MKPASRYRKGYAAERRTMKMYEQQGMEAIRSAGSHGIFDIVAMNEQGGILAQVKTGNAKMSQVDRERARLFIAPPNFTKVLVEWRTRERLPHITHL